MTNTQSIIRFGSAAQAELQAISQEMLAGVRNKDVGPAGNSLREMVTSLRGFTVDELDPNRKRSWWERLTGGAAPMAEFMARYEDVQGQIDKITGELLVARAHAAQGREVARQALREDPRLLRRARRSTSPPARPSSPSSTATTIPAKEAEVKAAPEDQGVMEAQELRDIRAARDDLERRVHDLQADPAGDDAVAAVDPAGAGERQEPGHQDQLDAGQHRAALGDPARPGGDDPPRPRGGGRGQGGERPDQRAPDARTPRTCARPTPRSAPRWSAASSTSRRCRRRTTT